MKAQKEAERIDSNTQLFMKLLKGASVCDWMWLFNCPRRRLRSYQFRRLEKAVCGPDMLVLWPILRIPGQHNRKHRSVGPDLQNIEIAAHDLRRVATKIHWTYKLWHEDSKPSSMVMHDVPSQLVGGPVAQELRCWLAGLHREVLHEAGRCVECARHDRWWSNIIPLTKWGGYYCCNIASGGQLYPTRMVGLLLRSALNNRPSRRNSCKPPGTSLWRRRSA